ncbi:MAG: orotate phosphoribosyltransferase [Spirochaetota bacterium]
MYEYKIAKLLLEIGAVSFRPNNPYRLASGIMSPIYIDCRVLNSYPHARKIVFDCFQDYIDSFVGRNSINLIVGSGHSGISLAAYLVEKMRMPMAYVRIAGKKHGQENQIEGIVKEGDKALLLSDILADDEHVPISVRLLKEKRVEIVHVLSIFNMKLNRVDIYLRKEGIHYFTLTDLRILLNTAVSEKMISLIEREEIEAWRKNFNTWGEDRDTRVRKELEERATEVARILLRIKAVTLSPSKPFRYSSGILSPIYCDNRLLISYPDEWQYIINSMLKIIVNVIGVEKIDIIGGTSTAGIPHAAYISDRLNLPMIYVKSAAEEHGKKTKIEGNLTQGQRVLVVEDLISTGGSSVKVLDSVRGAGGIVEHCIAIFTYEMEAARVAFQEKGCRLHTISNFSTLMKAAVEGKYITPEERDTAYEWSRCPADWGRNKGFE